MTVFWSVLYALLVLIALLFWRQARGCSLDELFARDLRLHERVHRVLVRHPGGGRWRQFRRWMEEDEDAGV